MRAARYDQVYMVPIAHNNARSVRDVGVNVQLLDREFGEEYRSSRLPAGWFILPSAITSLVFISIVLF